MWPRTCPFKGYFVIFIRATSVQNLKSSFSHSRDILGRQKIYKKLCRCRATVWHTTNMNYRTWKGLQYRNDPQGHSRSLQLLLVDRSNTRITSCKWPVVTTSLSSTVSEITVHDCLWPWEILHLWQQDLVLSKVIREEPHCHISRQKMDSPAACGSCATPTVDESTQLPVTFINITETDTQWRHICLQC